ncbi:hypothetical protein J2X31_003424 [Flavobacterium arsenatis]|uniref:Putative DNA-binding domain-containing protein n=1 Tax=Flavobacterium arsenatis TaxID=1484332 RepID=A0ABU1TU47_9FLAO|nr:DNA-binding domain-containing protein [Flavobacterium arsenatis]MDR6969393.1 hypothetical protein [Flavobacterium arsenatis]
MTTKDPLSINHIQNWMQAMLTQHVPVFHLDIPTNQIIKDSKRLSASQHLSIYRQSYIARLRSCMQSQFKCLAYALGESLFQDFADQYLDSHPSTSYTLNNLGKNFAAFLEKTRPQDEYEEENWPQFMIELATFEYALSEAFDAQEVNVNVPNIHTPDHLLTIAPQLLLFEHQFPICNFYLDFNANLLPELPFPQQSHCGISRQNYKLGLFSIGPDQYHFLNSIKSGASISEAQNELIASFKFKRKDLDRVWPIWKSNFIASGFIVEKS